MKKNILFIFMIVFVCSSCKTITVGTEQQVNIQSSVSGATAEIPGYGTYNLPATIALKKGDGPYYVSVCKKGYECQQLVIRKESDVFGVLVGNVLFGGLLGMIIDYGTGAAYELSPETLIAALEESDVVISEALMQEDTEEYVLLTVLDIKRTPSRLAEGIVAKHDLTPIRGIR